MLPFLWETPETPQSARYHSRLRTSRRLPEAPGGSRGYIHVFLMLFHGILAHGRFLASLLIARRSRSRSLFGIALHCTAFSLTVAFWHRSLSRYSRSRSLFGIALDCTAFSLTVAFSHRSVFLGILAHSRFLTSFLLYGRIL